MGSKGRPEDLIPKVRVGVVMPEKLYLSIKELLYSEVEGRIPYNTLNQFTIEAIKFYMEKMLELNVDHL